MEVGECFVNRFDTTKVYKVVAIHDTRFYAEQCFCRPDGMEVDMIEATMAYRKKDPQISISVYQRIKDQIESALKQCSSMVKNAKTFSLLPIISLDDGCVEDPEPQSGDYIIAYYSEVTTLFHVAECSGHKVSGEYFQIDSHYIEHDTARAFDLPEKYFLIDENLFSKLPKMMSMTETAVRALLQSSIR